MKKITIGALALITLTANTTLAETHLKELDIPDLAKGETTEELNVPFHETLPKIQFNSKHEAYYANVNAELHKRGLAMRHNFPDDVMGALIDFDRDGVGEIIIKNLATCSFSGCQTSIVKITDGKIEVLFQGNLHSMRFGKNPDRKQEELYVYTSPKHYKILNYTDGGFEPSYADYISVPEMKNLAYLDGVNNHINNLANRIDGLRNDINLTKGANAYFTTLDVNADGNSETMISVQRGRGCNAEGRCKYYVYTDIAKQPNFMLEALPGSKILLGKEPAGEIRSITFASDAETLTYKYSEAKNAYVVLKYKNTQTGAK
jgi:hypothetical protein